MSKINQIIHVIIFFNLVFIHQAPAADSCVVGKVSQIVDKIKNLTNDAQEFVKESPSKAVKNLKSMIYDQQISYLLSLGRFKIFDNPNIDQKIFNLLSKGIDDGVLELNDAHRTLIELERPSLLSLAKNSDHVLGLRFKKLTSTGESLSELAKSFSSRIKLGGNSESKLIEIFESALLSPDELKDIAKSAHLTRISEIEDLEHYMEYLSTLQKRPKAEGIKAINELFTPGDIKNAEVKKFFQLESKVNRYEGKLLKKSKASSWSELESGIVADMKGKSRLYRSLTYACRSSVPSTFHTAAGKSFVQVTTGLKVSLKVASYLSNNQDQPWDALKWRGLGWEVVSSFILSRVVSKLMTGNESGFNKLFKSYFLYRAAETVLYRDVVVEGGMYGLVVGGQKVVLDDDVLKILKDPNRKKEVDDLLKFIDDNKIAEKMIEKFNKVDWDKVSKGQYPTPDLNRSVKEVKASDGSVDEYEAFMEILTYSLTEKINAQNKDKIKKVYNFNAVYGFFASFESIFSSALTLQVMCMYQGSSKLKQYGYVLGITLLDSFATSEIYYTYRKNYAGM